MHMNIPNSEKIYIYERERKKCFYCGKSLKFRQITLDHYLPKSKGGTKEVFNLVLSCGKCNRLKENRVPSDYEERIIRLFQRAFDDGMIRIGKLIIPREDLKEQILYIDRIEYIEPNFVFQSKYMRFYIKNNTIVRIILLGGKYED
ncbi:hypothetical protein C3E88_10895 [Clostridium sp. Cult3]|nr:hypothetical protein [Clostridium sp. Cult3]